MKFLDVPRSGSYQGITSSRNRFGQYVRTRATPVNPSSTFQAVVRARLAGNATRWRTLTDAQRVAWSGFGANIQRTDSLGQYYTLTGLQAFTLLNNNLLASGASVVDDPPAYLPPDALDTVTATATAGTPAFSVAYTPTPLGAGVKLFIFVSPQLSAGVNFCNDLRLLSVTAAAAASPANILSAYVARFGALVATNKVFVSAVTHLNGMTSGVIKTAVIIGA